MPLSRQRGPLDAVVLPELVGKDGRSPTSDHPELRGPLLVGSYYRQGIPMPYSTAPAPGLNGESLLIQFFYIPHRSTFTIRVATSRERHLAVGLVESRAPSSGTYIYIYFKTGNQFQYEG